MRALSTLMTWSNKNKSCMRVDENLKSKSFYESLLKTMTNSRVASNSCSHLTRTRELTSKSLYESSLNSHALVKRQQELHES